MPLQLMTYHRGSDLPNLPGHNTFHSKELFQLYESTPGYKPLMIVAYQDNTPVANLLAVTRKSVRWFPPSIIKRCEVYGSGEYAGEDLDKESIFGQMLEHLTHEALRNAFLIEFRNLENSMFGYKYFRSNRYIPINWLRVRNSLHNLQALDERFSPSRNRQIKKGIRNGARVMEAETLEDIREFSQMLRNVYSSRIRKHFPGGDFFRHMKNQLVHNEQGKIFVVKYKDKIIGGATCIYSNQSAYLWFSGGMRKSYAGQYPGVLAVWGALQDAYTRGYRHLEFMDVGLPFRKHGYREFVLRFGGKQSSTRRWFRFRWGWLNNLLLKIYV